MNFLELLSPAGDAKSFKAAILAGANAIFFGVENFNARQRAENISFENLSDLINLAKSKNVKSYLTLNTLVYDSEFSNLFETVQKAIQCGIDAVIVQDMGVLYFVKQNFPDLEIHASTQMTTHNILQCEFLSEVGVSQINLSRELSLVELKPLVKFLNSKNIIAEIFVHGAYCISFSGQCYLSNYLYSEAGNRGLCVQPCRREFCSTEKKYLIPFNLKDNCALNFAKELKSLGNISLKIEGRIKNFDYVWAITKEWKNALSDEKYIFQNNKNNLVYKVMNRSYSDDYLKGFSSSNMFTFGSKDHSFVECGIVISYTASNCRIKLSEDYAEENDKILIKDKQEKFICSGILSDFDKNKNDFKLKINSKEFNKIYSGQKVYIQKDIIKKYDLENQINNLSVSKNKIEVVIDARLNKNLIAEFKCNELSLSCKIKSCSVLQSAKNNSLTKEIIFEKLNKLGNTNFAISKIEYDFFEEDLFLPIKELNEIKKNAIEYFEKNNLHKKNIFISDKPKFFVANNFKEKIQSKNIFMFSDIEKSKVHLSKNEKIILEFPCISECEEFILKKEFTLKNKNVIPYFPSVIFDNQLTQFKNLIDNLESNRMIFTENTGLMYYGFTKGLKVIGGQNLNITNSYSMEFYKKYLSGFVPSFETPKNEMINLIDNSNDIQVWFAKSSFRLLMQSRQCLLKKITNCKKENCDLDCIKNCQKKINVTGKNNEKITLLKRKGFYSAIYVPHKIEENFFNDKIDYYILDYRNIF